MEIDAKQFWPGMQKAERVSDPIHQYGFKQGILLLALGHPFYGQMASNLAMSLKFAGCPHIHLVYHGNALNHLSEEKKKLFDSISLCPDEAIMKNGKVTPFKAKTWMYELSPFDETIFLDVDMIWFSRSVNELFKQLSGVEFTIQNREYFDLSDPASEKRLWLWAKISDLRKHFTSGRLYSLHSEFVWFKKSESNKEYFDLVRQQFDSPMIQPNEFNGDVADELAFAIACIKLNKYPHESPFLPVWWYRTEKNNHGTRISELKTHFYAMSVGGNAVSTTEKEKYDQLSKAIGFKMNIKNPFKLKFKKSFIESRKSM